MKINEKNLIEIIGNIVTMIEENSEIKCYDEKSGIMSVDGSKVKMERLDTGNVNDKVWIKDVITSENNRNLAAGYMKMIETEFPWTLTYDEIDYVIEGELTIKINENEVVARAGDILMIPAGSNVIWSAREYARFVYVTYPANWSELVK